MVQYSKGGKLMEQYFNISDIANRYKVSVKTIRNWIKKGMPHLRTGNVIRFDVAEVENWIRTKEGE
jgi:excisionase family DNA binding protein